jgi:acetyl esterase/lipase
MTAPRCAQSMSRRPRLFPLGKLVLAVAALCAALLLPNMSRAQASSSPTRSLASAVATPQAQTPAAPPAVKPSETILLWPKGAPGAVGDTDLDKPTLDVYLPASNPTHSAVVICPGGGYVHLSMQKEGSDVAAWLNARGVAGFVLKYRLAPRYGYPAPIDDGMRAIRYVRAHAADYGLDANHIGMMGFSAGGHLTATVSTHFDAGTQNAADPINSFSDRPDFTILCYAALSMRDALTHGGSRHALLGDTSDPKLIDFLSAELQVTSTTPPTFIYHTVTDNAVPVQASVAYFEALLREGVPVEMHLFQAGPHGTGLGVGFPAFPELREWPTLLENWMRFNGWMAPAATAP